MRSFRTESQKKTPQFFLFYFLIKNEEEQVPTSFSSFLSSSVRALYSGAI